MRITLKALKEYAKESARIAKNCEKAFDDGIPEHQKFSYEYRGEKNAYEELFKFLNGDADFGEIYDIVVNKKY